MQHRQSVVQIGWRRIRGDLISVFETGLNCLLYMSQTSPLITIETMPTWEEERDKPKLHFRGERLQPLSPEALLIFVKTISRRRWKLEVSAAAAAG